MSKMKKRSIHCSFKATEEELNIIHQKMKALGITNQSAFIRAMTLNGYVLKLDLPELHQTVRLMGSMSNNVNQIARKLHEGGSMYETEIDEIKANQDELLMMLNRILQQLDHLNK